MNNAQKIWKYFKPVFYIYKKQFFAFSILFLIGNTVANSIIPIFYKNIINEATVQYSSGNFSFTLLNIILIQLLIALIISGIGRRLGSYFYTRFSNNAANEVHTYSFSKISHQSYHFFTNQFVGTLSGKVNRLARNFRDIIDTLFFGFILLIVDVVVTIFILLNENIKIGIGFILFFVGFILFSLVFAKKQSELDLVRAQKGSKRSGVLSDILGNIFSVQSFSSRQQEYDYYNSSVKDLKKAQLKTWSFGDNVRIIKNVIFILFEIGIMGIGLYLFSKQEISLGTLVLIQIYSSSLIINMWHLNRSLKGFIEQISDTADAIDVVTTPVSVYDSEFPEKLNINNAHIDINNISFTYPDGDHVFEKFSLNISAAQSLGIVGKSGSGKTTLTKLLLRLYDVDAGHIMIDGQNIAHIRQEDLRSKIAYIPQDTILFHRTIYENIAYGNPKASRDEVIDAAKSAHVDEFVQNLEHGYETKVGERGVKLSGGQRQRIGIARAMLKKDAPILIMDEATSSLDSKSEKYIQDSFEKLSEGRTTIVIAHRLSTIQKMDRILVMNHGNIIEDGSHEELLTIKGHYAELWNSQVNGFMQE